VALANLRYINALNNNNNNNVKRRSNRGTNDDENPQLRKALKVLEKVSKKCVDLGLSVYVCGRLVSMK